MLSIGAMGNGQGTYYVGLAREDYYLEGGEPPGRWIGQGAERLGIAGQVEREEFLSLFAGHDKNGEALVQNAGDPNRQPGWDLTFSAPKSVSLTWALSNPRMRQAIADAHFGAVKEATSYIEEGAITRRGKGGEIKEKADLLIATFEHGTSRAQDPQLHTHALVLNLGIREDGTTGTIESKSFYQSKMAAGALYRADLSHRLQELGFFIERQGSTFEVRGVPAPLIQDASKRRAEIEKALDERGEEGARASAFAALNTRSHKEHISREDLFAGWKAVGVAHGFGQKQIEALSQDPSHSDRDREQKVRDLRRGVKDAIEEATEKLTQDRSHFSERDLLRGTAEAAQGKGLWASLIRTAVEHEVKTNQEIVYLGEVSGEKRYTTRELLELEKKLLSNVDTMREGRRHNVEERTLTAAIAKTEREETQKAQEKDPTAEQRIMNQEQREALSHITQREGSIALVSGMAGTGKTFLLQAARGAWEKSGYTVRGAAVAGKAAKGLQEGAGIESGTLARLLMDEDLGKKPLDKNTVLVVDEAGMVGTRQMAELVNLVQKAEAKLVLVGDSRQLQPVEIGGPFRSIENRIGRATLTEIIRQEADARDRNPLWRREAVKDFADGNAAKALRAFQERGFLSVADDREKAMETLVSAWKERGMAKPGENLIFAGTRQEVRELNRMAQSVRDQEGKLGFRSVRLNGETIHEKDRVLITKTVKAFEVANGELGTVKHLDLIMQRMTVKMDDGREVRLPYSSFDHIELGYAVTTHKGQGVTVKNSYILCGGSMADREMSYVQASRAKKDTLLFTSKIEAWNPQTERREDRTLEELARQMSQSRQKDMAHDVVLLDRAPARDHQPTMSM